ncbi:MAG: hypothetical protein NC192_12155, partial [Muribaculaceae bacterium]|nr:hypothetical protein [Muribaculaceae bacterium]
IAYKTTSAFLRCFQLTSIDDLPPLPNSEGQVSFDEILITKEDTGSEVPEEDTEKTEPAVEREDMKG